MLPGLCMACLEEVVRKVLDVVQRVVIDDGNVVGVVQVPGVHDHGLVLGIVREKSGDQPPFADLLPPRAVLTTHGVPLEEYGLVVAKLPSVFVVRACGASVSQSARHALPELDWTSLRLSVPCCVSSFSSTSFSINNGEGSSGELQTLMPGM